MQILTRERTYETRSNTGQPWGPSTVPPTNGSLGMGSAGVGVSENTVLQLTAAYGSVALISEAIAALPIQQWRLMAGEAKQMDPAPVIVKPWSEIDQRDFITQGTMSMLLRGNLWGRKVGLDGLGLPEQVQLVHPDHARVRRLASGDIEFRYWNDPVSQHLVTRKMALSVPEGLQGLSPIEYLRNSFGLARAQDLHANAFYANSARPDGVIQVPEDLDEEQVIEMADAWRAAHQGINQSHLPAILTGGAEFKPIQMTMADAQFLQQVQFSAQAISGMIYRIPPHMLGMTEKATSWGKGIEQQELAFVRNTLLIWLCRWEDLMSSWLPSRQFVTFDLSQRLRGDTLQRWGAYQIARVIGAMTAAEVRAAEGLPKVDDPALDAFDQPLNSSPVKPESSAEVGPGGDGAD